MPEQILPMTSSVAVIGSGRVLNLGFCKAFASPSSHFAICCLLALHSCPIPTIKGGQHSKQEERSAMSDTTYRNQSHLSLSIDLNSQFYAETPHFHRASSSNTKRPPKHSLGGDPSINYAYLKEQCSIRDATDSGVWAHALSATEFWETEVETIALHLCTKHSHAATNNECTQEYSIIVYIHHAFVSHLTLAVSLRVCI
jgi:hypothetical protein